MRLTCAFCAATGLLLGQPGTKKLVDTNCTAGRLGTSIPVELIGEPVAAVALGAPTWKPAAPMLPAYCSIHGSMAPVETGGRAKPILLRVLLPSDWTERGAILGLRYSVKAPETAVTSPCMNRRRTEGVLGVVFSSLARLDFG